MAVYSTGESVNAIVADIGSYATKIGYAGEDYPRAYFRSNVAVMREEGSKETTDEKKQRRRRRPIQDVHYDSLHRPLNAKTGDDGNWESANPVNMTTGLWYDPDPYPNSADWSDLIPTFLRHGYESALGLKETSNNPLLLVERSYNPPPLRQQLLEIIMEECDVPATFFGKDATLACYACGRTTSTVIDIGYSGTTVTPVYEGYVEQKGIRRSPIGSKAMDELALEHLVKVLSTSESSSNNELIPVYQVRHPKAANKRHDAFHRLAMLDIAKDCRETGAGQSINTAASKSLQVPSMSFSLPDGQMVDIPSTTRFAVADLCVGTTSSADEDVNQKQASNNPREEAFSQLQNDFNSIVLAASAEENDQDMMDDDEDDDAEDDDMDIDRKKEQANKYTEASAVGVSSRRSTRGSSKKTDAKKETSTKAKVKFHNQILNRACASYLQTQLEQQLTASPVAGMVCDAAFRCDRDQQASVLGNVVLCGGGACIGPTDQAVPDLLREQIESIIHTHTPGWRVKVLSPSMQERSICSWLGGSILGSLGTFHDMWITKAEYEEWGSAIINRKCP